LVGHDAILFFCAVLFNSIEMIQLEENPTFPLTARDLLRMKGNPARRQGGGKGVRRMLAASQDP
jgi:hypothetical protein